MSDVTRDTRPQTDVSPPQRVITYIDGFNLYFGMKEAELRRFFWLDLTALGRRLLKNNQQLVKTKYFTSRIALPPASVRRQTAYIDALQTLPDFEMVEGRYEADVFPCPQCGVLHHKHNEKMTDVNIAVEVTKDAYANAFDTAIILTGDSDQVPTMRLLRAIFPGKRVITAQGPRRKSRHLNGVAHGRIDITSSDLKHAQLPPVVTQANGVQLTRPASWV